MSPHEQPIVPAPTNPLTLNRFNSNRNPIPVFTINPNPNITKPIIPVLFLLQLYPSG